MAESNEKKSRFQASNAGGGKSGRFDQKTVAKKNKTNQAARMQVSNKEFTWTLLVVAFVFSILPLITKAVVYDPHLKNFEWFSNTEEYIDIFLHQKQLWLTVCLVIMSFCMFMTFILQERKFKIEMIFYPLFAYGTLSLISTLLSPYRSFGLSGIFEQFEGIFAILAYVVIVYFVYLYVSSGKDIRILINVLAVGALIIGLIGAFQGMKLDFFRTDYGRWLISSEKVPGKNLKFSFDLGRAYVTLYNPNYVGVYCTLLLPLFAIMLPVKTKMKKVPLFGSQKYSVSVPDPFVTTMLEKLLYLADIVLLLISMFAAQFKAGIVSLAVVGVLMLVLLGKSMIKKWYLIPPVIVAVVGLYFVVDNVNGHIYSTSIKEAFKIEKTPCGPLSRIDTKKDCIEITYNGQEYVFKADATTGADGSVVYSGYSVTNSKGEVSGVYFSEEQNAYLFEEPELATFRLTTAFLPLTDETTRNGFNLNIDGKDWYFFINQKGYRYFNMYGKETRIKTADSAVFDGYEGFASYRGYIWSRTIPLLKKYFIIGSGADTFSIVFPQDDYVAANNYTFGSQLISKPHCLYMQVAVQSGFLGLVAMLVFYGMYFVQCIRLYSKKMLDSYLAQVGVAIFGGTIGYIVSSVSNDSSITVAPVFWGLMGLGIAVNAMVKNNIKE